MFLTETVARWKTIRAGRGVELLEHFEELLNELKRFDATQTPLPNKVSPEVQFNGYVEWAFAIYVGKFREFMEVAAECLNREQYVGLASCLRNVFEHCALLHHFLSEIEPISLRRKWASGAAVAADYDGALRVFDRLIRGNTFAWDALIDGNREELHSKRRESSGTQWQVPVGRTALASLGKDLPISNMLYNMLCDMVHPNMGGHMLLIRGKADAAVIGGSATKAPALDLAARLMALMLGVYTTIAEDLQRVQHLRLTLPVAS